MAETEPFYERFARLLQEGGLTDTEAAAVMGISAAQVSRIKKGIAGSIRFEDGLRLCGRLGIDPWYLAFGRERAPTQNPWFSLLPAPVDAGPQAEASTQSPEEPVTMGRLSAVEAELRETRAILKRLEAAVEAGEIAPARRRKGSQSA